VDEMNRFMVDSWNKVVKPEDEIYHLGDFFFKFTNRNIRHVTRLLNGKKYVIKGNHDRSQVLNNLKNAGLIEWWDYNHVLEYEHEGKNYTFQLSHYPHYPSKDSNMVCLHGHVHGIFEHHGHYLHAPNVLDVGVDNVGYEPISIVNIIDYIERQKSWNATENQ
jgi:calcineurin-like phosphoesterase family protein